MEEVRRHEELQERLQRMADEAGVSVGELAAVLLVLKRHEVVPQRVCA